MKSAPQAAAIAAAMLAMAGCNSGSSEQQAVANDSAAEPGVAAKDSVVTAANASDEAPAGEISTGMPVPGTNTPEHIVVNSDSDNGTVNPG